MWKNTVSLIIQLFPRNVASILIAKAIPFKSNNYDNVSI